MPIHWFHLAYAASMFGLALYKHFHRPGKRDLRAMKRVPVTPAAEADDGQEVRLLGHARVHGDTPLLESPITGRPCLAWQVLVWTANQNDLELVLDAADGRRFVLDDGTLPVEVPRQIVDILLDKEFEQRGHKVDRERLATFMRARGEDEDRAGVVYEGILEVGEPVSAWGVLRRRLRPTGQAGYRDGGVLLELEPLADGHMLVSDENAVTRVLRRADRKAEREA